MVIGVFCFGLYLPVPPERVEIGCRLGIMAGENLSPHKSAPDFLAPLRYGYPIVPAGLRRDSGSGPGRRMFAMIVPKTAGTQEKSLSAYIYWLGYQDLNLGVPESKSGALPLGDTPKS